MLSPLIDTFLTVARYLSFTRAAQELYTTQPTISRQIAALEEEWGFPLFIRSNKEVALTEEGALMLDACQKAGELLSDAQTRSRELRQNQAGSLRIGVLSSMDEQRTLLPALSYFDEMYKTFLRKWPISSKNPAPLFPHRRKQRRWIHTCISFGSRASLPGLFTQLMLTT